jgi:prepilin-type processing-associated H-X9-DG protein
MKDVPSGAMMAGAGTFRIANVLPLVMKAVRAASPEQAAALANSIEQFELETGVPVRKNVLENFAGPYTFYVYSVNNVMLGQGAAVLLDVKDGPMLEAGLTGLERWAAGKLPPDLIRESERTIGDQKVTLHTWNLVGVNIPIQVGWAVCKGKLVVELSATAVGGAVDHLVTGGPSLQDDPAFAAVAGRYPSEMSNYSFSDDRARTGATLGQLASLWSALQMAAKQAGDMILPFLPPSSDIVRHLGVTAAYTHFDDAGMHTRSGGSLPAGDPVIATASVATLTSILLPSLSRARELSKRVVVAANLKGIGTCCKIYANENEDRYPPSLQTLIESGDISPRMLQSPRVGDPDTPNHYVYIPGHTEAGDSRLIVAYENPAYVEEGINILYLDGHVTFVRGAAAFAQIRETYEKMGLPVPDLAYGAGSSTRFLDKFNPDSAAKKNK